MKNQLDSYDWLEGWQGLEINCYLSDIVSM